MWIFKVLTATDNIQISPVFEWFQFTQNNDNKFTKYCRYKNVEFCHSFGQIDSRAIYEQIFSKLDAKQVAAGGGQWRGSNKYVS